MDIGQRQERIAHLVRLQKQVRTAELSAAFDVSTETIRKDLLDLAERGVLVRVHGGARLRPGGQESAYERRRTVNTAAKAAIAAAALDGVAEGACVYLDYGTTTYALAAEFVRAGYSLSVITNSLPIAALLADSDAIETVVLGGLLRRNERSLFGPLAESAIDGLYMDVGFFGCAGLHPEAGMTNHHPFEGAASRKALSHCRDVVTLVDAAKFNRVAAHKIADLHEIDLLITDSAPDVHLGSALAAAAVSVAVAEKTADVHA